MPIKSWVWGALLVLGGCAIYSEPGRDVPTAELILSSNLADDPFATGDDGAKAANRNAFYAFGDANCESDLGAMGQFLVHDGGRKIVRVEAGKRIWIRADWHNQVSVGHNQEAHRSCFNLVSFVPEAGETYDLSQEILREPGVFGVRAQCRAVVRTFADTRPVKSFQEHEFRGKCADLIKGA